MGSGLVGRHDARLRAVVTGRRSLRYAAGADRGADRPGHVRAASGLAWLGGRLAIVQDDASFVALLAPGVGDVDAIALPAPDGVRLFDDGRGNKARKLDLEACVAADGELFAFGSGSSPARERIVRLRPGGRVEVIDGAAFYAGLRARDDFAGSELNLEGAVLDGARLRLFQRGNGAARDDRAPVDAIGDVDWAALRAWLDGGPPPTLDAVTPVALGSIGGVRLTFTDAALGPGGIRFVAAAEDSPDAVRDGPVAGVAVGTIGRSDARWTPILDERGAPLLDKVEGLALDPADPARAWAVADRDDPDAPAELLELALSGPW